MSEALNSLVERFDIVLLKDLDQIAYNERVDLKFVFSYKLVPWLLSEVISEYKVLKVEESLLQPYRTVYFDTPSLQLYLDHHNGKLNRYKIRKRVYLANNVVFSEIKFKNNKGLTLKKRLSSTKNPDELTDEDLDFFLSNVSISREEILPQASNSFSRITLVNLSGKERITIDFNLKLERFGKVANLERMVIAEIKKPKYQKASLFERKLKELGIRCSNFSKYCTTIAMIEENKKSNHFKLNLSSYKKINNEH